MPPSEAAIRIARTSDTQAILDLLVACRLPVDGVPDDVSRLWVAEQDGRVVGTSGLEVHGTDGLLRSLAVAPDLRGRRIADRLCDALEQSAPGLGARHLYLLTETAEPSFQRRGYRRCERSGAPSSIAASREFAAVCPTSAVLMCRDLG